MKPFQVALAFLFGILALVAVFIFATFTGGQRTEVGDVVIWGSAPQDAIEGVLKIVTTSSDGFEGVEYREIAEESLVPELVEAIASGRGPDLILLPSEYLVSQSDKIALIPYRTFSKRDFQDSYIQAAEVLLTDGGVLGLPFFIDPYVMYWNRTLFANAGIARAPGYWDEVGDVSPRLTQLTSSGTVTQSAVALGQWDNVTHAKEIFVSLLFGLGNTIVAENSEGELQAVLSDTGDAAVPPAESALRFYTEFADPVKSVYSWNRSLPDARSAFVAGDVAMYFGGASEAVQLRAANPNLNFDVAPYPTVRDGSGGVPAHLIALSIPRGARNVDGAFETALLLSGFDVQGAIQEITGLPSVRRDAAPVSPDNAYEAVFRDAALKAFVWFDPNPERTDALFKRMVEDVASGRLRVAEAVRSGQSELSAILEVQ